MENLVKKRPVALVTGASRGIGEAIAERLAEKGYDLYLTCRVNFAKMEEMAKGLSSRFGVTVVPVCADMSSFSDVEELFSDIEEIDVLVNNAGISYVGLLSEMTPEEWHRVLGVNLDSVFYTSKLAIPKMLQKHSGRIINISSVWGNAGASMEVAYSASKGGVNSFTRALAKELAPSGIAVNAIACGVIDTDMNNCFSQEEMETLRQEIPADRIGTPKEVADTVLSLLETPVYLTGQIVTLDGGWM